MKTGRLLKFNRKDADVQAYLYHEGGRFHAAIYVSRRGVRDEAPPAQQLTGRNGSELEDEVRAWVDAHYPR